MLGLTCCWDAGTLWGRQNGNAFIFWSVFSFVELTTPYLGSRSLPGVAQVYARSCFVFPGFAAGEIAAFSARPGPLNACNPSRISRRSDALKNSLDPG